MKTIFIAAKQCDIEVLMARKGGSENGYTTSQVFSLMVATEFSREFKCLLGY